MKNQISVNEFKYFIEQLPIISHCSIGDNDVAVLKLSSGKELSLKIVIVSPGYPKQIKDFINHNQSNLYTVFILPFISEKTSSICKDNNVGYLDLSGNCYLAIDSLYIDIKGNQNKNIKKRSLKSIYQKSSTASSLILRVLLKDIHQYWKMQELANAANCSLGQAAKVKEFLLNQDYIEQTKHGIRVTKARELMESWAKVYAESKDEIINCYCLNDISTIENKLSDMRKEQGIDCMLTGFSGGSRYQPVVRYQKVHILVSRQDIHNVINYLNLKQVDSGSNVSLIIKYDNCIDYDSREQDGIIIASPVQTYLDCMTLMGRGEEMAQAILEREICK